MQLGISESYVTKIYDACDTVKPQATLDPLRIQVQGGGMSAVWPLVNSEIEIKVPYLKTETRLWQPWRVASAHDRAQRLYLEQCHPKPLDTCATQSP